MIVSDYSSYNLRRNTDQSIAAQKILYTSLSPGADPRGGALGACAHPPPANADIACQVPIFVVQNSMNLLSHYLPGIIDIHTMSSMLVS